MKSRSGPTLPQAIRKLKKNDTSSIRSKQTKEEMAAWAPKFKPRASNDSKTASNWGTTKHYVTRRLLYLLHWQTFPAWFCINMVQNFLAVVSSVGPAIITLFGSEGWPHCFSSLSLPLTPDTWVNWFHLGMGVWVKVSWINNTTRSHCPRQHQQHGRNPSAWELGAQVVP